MNKTIVIESNFAFDENKRGIGVQLSNWLNNISWGKYSDVNFILTYFEGKNYLKNLPNNVSVQKIKGVNNFDDYLKKIYKELEFDVIFFQMPNVKNLKKGVKTVVVNYGMENLYARNYLENINPNKLIKDFEWSLKNYDLTITVSKNSQKDLMWFYPEYSNKIKVVYTGIEFFNKKNVGTENKLVSKNKYFFVIGYENKKNIKRIVSAFDSFKSKTGSDLKLAIAGKPGFGADEIDKHINSLEFKNDIIKLGYISDDEKIWLLRNCHSLIALPIYEGFGISALEGLFFGKKVLVSNNGSLKEIVGRAGFLADPFDVKDMGKKMIEISKLRGNPKKEYISERLKVYDQKMAAEKLVELLISV